MGDGTIRINTVFLKKDAHAIQDSLMRMNEAVCEMYQIKTELDKMWDDPSGESFKSEWMEELKDLESLIEDMRFEFYEYERNAIQKYEKCEVNVMSIISNLHV